MCFQKPNTFNMVSLPTVPNHVITTDGFQVVTCNTFYHAINEVKTNTQAPIGLVEMTALAALSISCQNLIDVQLPIDNTVPTSLMLFLVADSGERKSTVEKKFFASIREFEQSQFTVYEKQYAEWEIADSIFKQKQRGLNDAIRKKSSKGLDTSDEERLLKEVSQKRVAPPKKFKLLYENVTSEALFSGLYNHFPAAGLVSSEGVNIFKSTAFKDFGKQNSMWSGEDIVVDRVKGESYHLRDARLTVFIMVQSSILQDYLDTKGHNARGSGLLARALMYQPLSTQGQRAIGNLTTSWEHIHRFNDKIKLLLEMNINHVGKERKAIRFSTEAAEAWFNYAKWVESNISPVGIYRQAKDHASKLAENVGRVAALLHFFEGYDGDISLNTFIVACNICHSCSEYFVKKFNALPQEEIDAQLLLMYITNIPNNLFVSQRYIQKNFIRQYGPNTLRNTEILNKAIAVLVRCGMIALVSNNKTKYIDKYPSYSQIEGFTLSSL